jgi:hypothetical protein
MLLPDAAGVASYQPNTFTSAGSAQIFVDSVLRGSLPHGAVLFWALDWEPEPTTESRAEALVLIRDVYRGAVYPFSFADLDSAYDFVRHEMSRGLDLECVMLYWALPARLEADFWGRAAIAPATPPARQSRPRPLRVVSGSTDARDVSPLIHFEGASQRVRARAASLAAWGNFLVVLDEALDAHVARQVSAGLAWSRLSSAMSHAAQAHLRETAATDEPSVSFSDIAARQAWSNVAIAMEEAHYAKSLDHKALAIRAWRSASRALGSALQAKRARDERLRRCWLNAAFALSEGCASYVTMAARRRRSAFNGLKNIVLAIGEAFEASAWQGKLIACWQAASVELGQAVRAHVLLERAVLVWRRLAAALRAAAAAETARREAYRSWWLLISSALGAAAEREVFRQNALAIWSTAAVGIGEACEASGRYRRAVNAWNNIRRCFVEAAYAHHRRTIGEEAWRVLPGAVRQALIVDAKLRIAEVEADHELMAAVDRALWAYRAERDAGRVEDHQVAGMTDVAVPAPSSWPTTWRTRDDESFHGFGSRPGRFHQVEREDRLS